METHSCGKKQSTRRVSASTRRPHWKEKLRNECLARIQRERSALLWKFRRHVHSAASKSSLLSKDSVSLTLRHIVAEELRSIDTSQILQTEILSRATNGFSTSTSGRVTVSSTAEDMLWDYDSGQAPGLAVDDCLEGLTEEEYQELLLEMERTLHEDAENPMSRAEEQMLKDEEQVRALESAELAALADYRDELEGEHQILCPLCKQHCIQQSGHLLFCKCGRFQLDVRNEQVDLACLKRRLGEAFEEHLSLGCAKQPCFYMEDRFGHQVLMIQCGTCEMLELVL